MKEFEDKKDTHIGPPAPNATGGIPGEIGCNVPASFMSCNTPETALRSFERSDEPAVVDVDGERCTAPGAGTVRWLGSKESLSAIMSDYAVYV